MEDFKKMLNSKRFQSMVIAIVVFYLYKEGIINENLYYALEALFIGIYGNKTLDRTVKELNNGKY